MYKETILIVDDDYEIRKLIEIYLKNERYNTIQVENGEDALEALQHNKIDLIILDIMMPQMDGIEACLKIREEKNMPIIMLSAKSEDIDKIMGLSSGADDYITKPFNPLELIARIKSQLRRYFKLNKIDKMNHSVVEIDGLCINNDTHQIYVDGKEVKLTPREFDILKLLASNKNIVFNTEKIYEKVWKEDYFDSNNTVMVHIRKLREKIEDNPRKPKYIKTVWGVGYKIEG